MREKRFRVRFEQEDGRGEIVNGKGVELTAREVVDLLNEQQSTIQSLKEENRKLRNIHLSIDLTYSYGFGRYLTDVRVIDDE